MTSRPIFIVGMNGSGTTMLLDCLNNHPDIYGFERETKIIPHFIRSADKYGDLNNTENFRNLWNAFRNFPFFKYVNNGNEVPLPKDWQDTPRSVAGVIDGTMGYFAKQDGKTRWCEKTPMHAQHITLLAETFPDAKFIHIIRDGRACAASFHRRWGFSPGLTVYRWKRIVREAQRQGKLVPDRYLELRYEELTSDPETWLRKVCDFLQVPYDERVITLSRARNFTGPSDAAITSRKEYWRDYFKAAQIDAFDRISGKTLHDLGYKTGHPDSDLNPGTMRIKYWRYKDNAQQVMSMIRFELSPKRSGGRWNRISGRILRTIRQRLTNRL